MAARAMWKGVLRLGEATVPVKLYAAVEDRGIHFRLLHRTDEAPVKQAMVHPETDEVVPYEVTRRGYVTSEGALVVLNADELEVLEPEASRDIHVTRFVPREAIDHRWYDRPYYLGPDGSDDNYLALTEALGRSGREGLAHWVMRKKQYVGALRVHEGHAMLVSLHRADEVIAAEALEAPEGPSLDARELRMAQQLMEMLEADFEPKEYRDEYRDRVMKLIETKARGGKVKLERYRPKRATEDLTKVLQASLQRERKRA